MMEMMPMDSLFSQPSPCLSHVPDLTSFLLYFHKQVNLLVKQTNLDGKDKRNKGKVGWNPSREKREKERSALRSPSS